MRVTTRTSLHSSQLLRLLSDWAAMDSAVAGGAFAQKLSLWVDYTDAIALHAVHNNPPSVAATSGTVAAHAAAQELQQVRARLERAIDSSTLPLPETHTTPDTAGVFEPLRRYYLAQQRDLEAAVGPLRAKLREELGRASPALRQLAALDAKLDSMLSERESRLLYTVPKLLKRRFEHLLQTHQQTLQDPLQADNPALWMRPGAWLARFCSEMQSVLRAELDLRLQPALGLLEALQQEQAQQV